MNNRSCVAVVPSARHRNGSNILPFSLRDTTQNRREINTMKNIILASACIIALSSPPAFAQQPTGGASSQGNVGPGASQGAVKDSAGSMKQGTTGASRPSPKGDASTSGAGTAAGVNNTGSATEPGAVKSGVNKQ